MARSLAGRVLRWGLYLVGAIAIVYLVGANLILNTGILDPVINKKPEKTLVEWSGGWTIIPGVIHVEGLRVRGQSQTQQWQFRLAEADVRMSILALTRKTIRARRVVGSNFHFRQRPRLTAETAASVEASHYPEIEGLSNPPDPAPEDIYPPKKKPGKKGWHIDIAEVRLSESVEISVGDLRLTGSGAVGGAFDYQIPTRMHLTSAVFSLANGEIAIEGTTFVNELDISLNAELGPFTPKETKGLEIFDHLLGSFSLENGTVPDVEVINALLPTTETIRFDDGAASFSWKFDKVSKEEGSSGDMVIAGENTAMLMGGRSVSGDFAIDLELVRGSLAQGAWQLVDTSLALDNIDIRLLRSPGEELGDEGPTENDLWWARFNLKAGHIDLGDPNLFSAEFDFRVKNTEPVMHLIFAKETEEGGAKLPRWVKAIPDVHDLEGKGSIHVDGEAATMRDVVVEGDKLGLTAWSERRGEVVNGRLFFRLKGLSIGLEVIDGKKDLKILHPRRWASQQPGLDQRVVGYDG